MFEPGAGTMIGGAIGAIVGGFIGYQAGDAAAGELYDWAENTRFIPGVEIPVPRK